MFQPLLGKVAPARNDLAAAPDVCRMCHKPARKEKNGRRRNRDESIRRKGYSVENLLLVQCVTLVSRIRRKKSAQIRGYSHYPQSSRTAAWPRCADHAVISLVTIQDPRPPAPV